MLKLVQHRRAVTLDEHAQTYAASRSAANKVMFIQNVERERQDPRVVITIKSKLSSIESLIEGQGQSSARPSVVHGSLSDCDLSDNEGED